MGMLSYGLIPEIKNESFRPIYRYFYHIMKNIILGILIATTGYLLYEVMRKDSYYLDEIDFDNEVSPLSGRTGKTNG